MIRCLIVGTLHKAPVARTAANGGTFVTAKVRVDDKDGANVWVNAIAFGSEAERLLTLRAGDVVSIAGGARVSAWIKGGEAVGGLSVTINDLATLRGKPKPKARDQGIAAAC